MSRPAIILLALFVFFGCATTTPTVYERGYYIDYNFGTLRQHFYTPHRPYLLGGQVYLRVDSLREYWFSGAWSVLDYDTAAETDSIVIWWPWLAYVDSMPAPPDSVIGGGP